VFLSSIEQLLTIHKKFLQELEKWWSGWKIKPVDGLGIASVFQSYSGLFMIYGNYFQHFWKAVPALQKIAVERNKKSGGSGALNASITWEGLCLGPVKHMIHYQAFLKKAASFTEHASADADCLRDAFKSISRLCDSINDLIKKKEDLQPKKNVFFFKCAWIIPGKASN
jgi:hypothetical protein